MEVFTELGRKEYLSLNPGDQMPTIIRGYQTLIGDPSHIYKFLCRSENIDQKFYPTKDMNRDKKKIIDLILENL